MVKRTLLEALSECEQVSQDARYPGPRQDEWFAAWSWRWPPDPLVSPGSSEMLGVRNHSVCCLHDQGSRTVVLESDIWNWIYILIMICNQLLAW